MLLLHSTLNWLIFKWSLVWCSLTLNLSRGMWPYCTGLRSPVKHRVSRCFTWRTLSSGVCRTCCFTSRRSLIFFSSSCVCSDSGGGVQEDDPGGGEDGGGSASGPDTLLYDVASTHSAPPPTTPTAPSPSTAATDSSAGRRGRPWSPLTVSIHVSPDTFC